MKRNLSDMTILITGASAGIGKALAVEANRRGARLLLAARRVDRLEAMLSEFGGDRHFAIAADVSKPDDCRKLIDTAFDRFGRLDTLVCNAGYGLGRSVVDTTEAEWDAIWRTNVMGTTDCIRAAVPRMKIQSPRSGCRGQVMIVSSAAARRGLVYFGAYSATKAAQLSIAEAMRVELRKDEIAVTSVHPVTTATDFFTTAERHTGRQLQVPGRTPLSQTAEQVARAMLRAIECPTRECWPHRPSRWALSLVTLAPSLGDFVMRRVKRVMDR